MCSTGNHHARRKVHCVKTKHAWLQLVWRDMLTLLSILRVSSESINRHGYYSKCVPNPIFIFAICVMKYNINIKAGINQTSLPTCIDNTL